MSLFSINRFLYFNNFTILEIVGDNQNFYLLLLVTNVIKIGDTYYYQNAPVKIISILSDEIVEILGEKNGIPFNVKVPISDLKSELKKVEFFFF